MKTFSMSPGEEKKRLIRCPVCGYPESSPRWSGSMGFATCGRCGLVYQNPQPMLEDLAQRYDDEYFEYELENEENFFSLMRKGLEDIGFPAIAGDLPRKFLDVGCATGKSPSESAPAATKAAAEPATAPAPAARAARIPAGASSQATAASGRTPSREQAYW